MNDLNPDHSQDDPALYLIHLEQTNRELGQQVADCQAQLSRMRLILPEVQSVFAHGQQLETERSTLRVAERELTDLKSNFIQLASHEFRTPMMTILSSASLISRYNGQADGENRERHVQRIKSAIVDLTTMLNAFLSISQTDQYSVNLHPHALNLGPFCQALLTELQGIAKPQQRFHYQHLAGDPSLAIDEMLLKNILLNLLSNASKYSAQDSDIWLTSAHENKNLLLTVRDQGIGIPEIDQPNLFINFFRARNAIHIQGAGLGLYLAKRYVDLLGGTITFTSQVGEGTIFRVQLPLASKPV